MSVIELIDTLVKENPEKLAVLIRSNNKFFRWYWLFVEENTMDDLISRDAAIEALSFGKEMISRVLDDMDVVGRDREKFSYGLGLIESCIEDIEELPSAQPERKKGEWIDDNCSVCGQYVHHGDARNFCPNCGADMRGGQDETD